MDSGQITLVTAVSSPYQENDQMRKRSCSRESEMLSRNRRVPHPMEIYPGASDLHTLGMRTEGLQGYPALTHMLLCYLPVTTQAEHTPKKGGQKMSSGTVQASRQSGLPGQPPQHETGYCLHGMQGWLVPQHCLVYGDCLPQVITRCSSGPSPAALDTRSSNETAGSS